jgi:hypothetical protein
MGDFIELPSLSVAEYIEDGNVIAEAVNIPSNAGNGKLQLVIVAINPYYNQNSNGIVTPHLIFQFKNAPGIGRIHKTAAAASTNGYLNSSIRTYLRTEYLVGLCLAGVPSSVLWSLNRQVPWWNGYKDVYNTIKDKVWLPSEFEITGYNYARIEGQTHFAYYNSDDRRKKTVTGSQIANCYWTSASGDSTTYHAISKAGSQNKVENPAANTIQGIVPAFAIK